MPELWTDATAVNTGARSTAALRYGSAGDAARTVHVQAVSSVNVVPDAEVAADVLPLDRPVAGDPPP